MHYIAQFTYWITAIKQTMLEEGREVDNPSVSL